MNIIQVYSENNRFVVYILQLSKALWFIFYNCRRRVASPGGWCYGPKQGRDQPKDTLVVEDVH